MQEYLNKDVVKDSIRKYFKNKLERDIDAVDVVDANAELQKIFDEAIGDDVALVKRGEWIERDSDYDTYWDCSVCGESFYFIEDSPTDNAYAYCPNCGAKMDGDSNV